MSKKPIIALIVFALLLVLGAWFFTDIFSYFIVSMVIATLLKPLVTFFTSKLFFPRALGILFSVIVLVGLISILARQFVPLISEQAELIASIDIDRLLEVVKGPIISIHDWLLDFNLIPEDTDGIEKSIKEYLIGFIGNVNVKGVFNTIFSLTGSVFISVLALSFITFFLANNPGMVKKLLLNLVPNSYFEISAAAINKIDYLLGRYFRGIFIQMFFIFSIASIGLGIAGVKYAVTIALFAALINVIPYLGPMLGAIFGIIIGATTSDFGVGGSEFYWLLSKIAIVFAVVQVTDNVLLQPIIFSKSLKAHPLEIFVIIFVGANLGGAVGMIVAIPTYTIVKVSISELLRGYKQYKIFKKV